MLIRRVVTGSSKDGQSIILSDGPSPRVADFKHVPGFRNVLLWETLPNPSIPHPGVDHDPSVTLTSFVPPPGGTNLMVVDFPPDAVMTRPEFDPTAAGAEYFSRLPGLAETFEIANPGMHTTDTVDYGVVLEGEIVLELDSGMTKTLHKYDVVIQNGTRHAWRNPGTTTATMLFVLMGAHREK